MLTYLSILNIVVDCSQTSIVFSLEEGPGILFKALAVFALRQINLTKVCFSSWHQMLVVEVKFASMLFKYS